MGSSPSRLWIWDWNSSLQSYRLLAQVTHWPLPPALLSLVASPRLLECRSHVLLKALAHYHVIQLYYSEREGSIIQWDFILNYRWRLLCLCRLSFCFLGWNRVFASLRSKVASGAFHTRHVTGTTLRSARRRSDRVEEIFWTRVSKKKMVKNDSGLILVTFLQVGHSLFPDRRAVVIHSWQNLWRHSFVVMVPRKMSRQIGHIKSAFKAFRWTLISVESRISSCGFRFNSYRLNSNCFSAMARNKTR